MTAVAEVVDTSDHPTPGTRSRPFSHRHSLPSGRAVVGALLVSVAAVAGFASVRSSQGGPTGTVVLAVGDLSAGQRLAPGDLEEHRVDLPEAMAERTFAHISDVAGSVAAGPVHGGDPVLRSSVLTAEEAPAASRVFSFSVDRERALDGALVPGEHLDLIATYGSGESALTQVVARQVTVVKVGEPSRGALGTAGKLTLTVSLAQDAEVVRVTHASQVAALTLVRSTDPGSGTDPSPEARTPAPTPVATSSATSTIPTSAPPRPAGR